ncbi:proline-rich protein 2-like [Austrofundulus limnaeus]|uniref:Proline-rich protein 2-like n=1 Tax=Austrofundulus limnaeus TaxID=52670 RepID=A0A2I4C5E7_AUSLI|nr:PREDICTED: proline-rich protein 2-like [Austrofundulus limnaeus]
MTLPRYELAWSRRISPTECIIVTVGESQSRPPKHEADIKGRQSQRPQEEPQALGPMGRPRRTPPATTRSSPTVARSDEHAGPRRHPLRKGKHGYRHRGPGPQGAPPQAKSRQGQRTQALTGSHQAETAHTRAPSPRPRAIRALAGNAPPPEGGMGWGRQMNQVQGMPPPPTEGGPHPNPGATTNGQGTPPADTHRNPATTPASGPTRITRSHIPGVHAAPEKPECKPDPPGPPKLPVHHQSRPPPGGMPPPGPHPQMQLACSPEPCMNEVVIEEGGVCGERQGEKLLGEQKCSHRKPAPPLTPVGPPLAMIHPGTEAHAAVRPDTPPGPGAKTKAGQSPEDHQSPNPQSTHSRVAQTPWDRPPAPQPARHLKRPRTPTGDPAEGPTQPSTVQGGTQTSPATAEGPANQTSTAPGRHQWPSTQSPHQNKFYTRPNIQISLRTYNTLDTQTRPSSSPPGPTPPAPMVPGPGGHNPRASGTLRPPHATPSTVKLPDSSPRLPPQTT